MARIDLDTANGAAMKFRWGSEDSEGLREFKLGMQDIQEKRHARALRHMQAAVELEGTNPYFLSYLGLLTGVVRKDWREGERLCEEALRRRRTQPQLYLNLAELYLKQHRRQDAVETLVLGMHFSGRDARLHRALAKLGVRRPPVLGFLPRNHFVNRQLGKLRHRLLRIFGEDGLRV